MGSEIFPKIKISPIWKPQDVRVPHSDVHSFSQNNLSLISNVCVTIGRVRRFNSPYSAAKKEIDQLVPRASHQLVTQPWRAPHLQGFTLRYRQGSWVWRIHISGWERTLRSRGTIHIFESFGFSVYSGLCPLPGNSLTVVTILVYSSSPKLTHV